MQDCRTLMKRGFFETLYWAYLPVQTIFRSENRKSVFWSTFFDVVMSTVKEACSCHVARRLEASQCKGRHIRNSKDPHG